MASEERTTSFTKDQAGGPSPLRRKEGKKANLWRNEVGKLLALKDRWWGSPALQRMNRAVAIGWMESKRKKGEGTFSPQENKG